MRRVVAERGHEAYILRLLGEITAHRDPTEVEEAAAHYRQALAEALGMRPLQAIRIKLSIDSFRTRDGFVLLT